MRKIVSILVIAVLLFGMTSMTASAHGGHRKSHKTQAKPRYELCAVEGCSLTKLHKHNSTWYCGHISACADYESCPIADCTIVGIHEHGSVNYHCATPHGGCRNR